MLGSKRKNRKLPLPEEPVRIDSPSLMERLRAVPVEYDDPFAGEVYRPRGQAPGYASGHAAVHAAGGAAADAGASARK